MDATTGGNVVAEWSIETTVPVLPARTDVTTLPRRCGSTGICAQDFIAQPVPTRRLFCYSTDMLKTRIKRLAKHSEQAAQRLAAIEASITSLDNEDLLDLADIFKAEASSPLGAIAGSEMKRRNISL